MADALERDLAAAVLATRQGNAPVTVVPVETELASALARAFAVAVQRVAAFLADWHVAQVTGPSGQALDVAVVVTYVVGVLVLGGRDFAGLEGGKG